MSAQETRVTLITAWQGFWHMTDETAAGLAGVSRRTWLNWKQRGFDIPISQLTDLVVRMRIPKEDACKILLADYPIKK